MVAPDPLFACEGEMARRMSTHHWASSPLGCPSEWSPTLRTAVSILLRTRHPMLLSWGEDLAMLYNDAFVPTLGTKHPGALGDRLERHFAEVWDTVGPMQRSVLAGGPSTWDEDLRLTIERGTGPEETFFTFSYSHVPDHSDAVAQGPGGVLATLSVTTDKVVAARRLAMLNDLAGATDRSHDPDEALAAALGVLGGAEHDLLGAALYRRPGAGSPLVRSATVGLVCDAALPDVVADEGHVVGRCLDQRGLADVRHDGCSAYSWGGHVVAAVPVRDRSDGADLVLALLPHPLRPFDEDHRRFVGLVADRIEQSVGTATERAQEQAHLQALAAVDAAKTAFISSISHEFRTPLTLLLGPLEDVLNGRAPALGADDVEVMHRSAHRLLRMVNALLDVARIEAGGLVPEPEVVDLAELTRDLTDPFQAAADRAGLELSCSLAGDLGLVSVDPRLWETIVLNVVANAVKFTPSGRVDLSLTRAGDEVVVRVSDTGVGIPAEELAHVFERFHRVAAHGGKNVEGTGIGLSLVAEASRATGGTASVTSEEGAGSDFEVRLPLPDLTGRHAPGEPSRPTTANGRAWAEEIAPTPVPTVATSTARAGDRVVLVVEDNTALRARVARVLAELGEVVTAADGVEALQVLRGRRVDLVVTDVMMPNLDGLGLLKEIRADETLWSVPVILLSARAGAEAATGAVESGADDYVVKPFTSAELLARCRTTLNLVGSRADAAASQVRSTLLAGVSHDMQTPLAVITSTLELLAGGEIPPEDVRRMSDRAQARARQLTSLVTQFLDWSRLTMNQPLPILKEATELRSLAHDVVAHHEQAAVTGPELDLVVFCDPRRTQQILHNLVDNAGRFARSTVGVELTLDDDRVLVRVSDDGTGVPPAVRERLFEAFGPSSSTTGNGLGLHISRAAARAQGGDLSLESSSPAGSVFLLWLPHEERP